MKRILKNSILLLTMLFNGLGMVAQEKEPVVHDPVVIREGDTYYLFCTGRGIKCLSSKDLVTWKKEPAVFKEKPDWAEEVVPGFENHIWAPDITFKDGTYFLYYSVSTFAKNTSAIGLVTNKTLNPESPEYLWEDQGIVVQSVPNRDMWNAIDPNLIFDDHNQPWLAFGSFWNGLKMVKMDEGLKKISDPEEWYTIARRERSFELPDTDPGDAALEAPFIFKKFGYYYQFLSWDLCCRGENSTYKIVVGRSRNVTGPYLDKNGKPLNEGGGTLILQGNENWFGAGHNSVYTFEGKDYMFFHAYKASQNGSPKLKIVELDWDKDEWPLPKENVLE